MTQTMSIAEQIISAIDGAAMQIDGVIKNSYLNHDPNGLSMATSALTSLSATRVHAASLVNLGSTQRPTGSAPTVARKVGRPRKVKAMVAAATAAEPTQAKRGPGRPRKNDVATKAVRSLTTEERERRKSVRKLEQSGGLTGSKTYRPYLLRALHETDSGTGLNFPTIQGKMRSMMEDVIKPADDLNVPGTNRPRWMYQTSALRHYLVSQGLISQVGVGKNDDPLYSITARGRSEIQAAAPKAAPRRKGAKPRRQPQLAAASA